MVTCAETTGIERKLPCGPIPTGKILKAVPEFTGISPNPAGDMFTGVKDPTGSGRTVIKNINRSGQGDGHATMTTGRQLQKGSISYCAFDWLYMPGEFEQTGRNLIWQLQMSGSPTCAISTEQKTDEWIFVTRDGTAMRRESLGKIQPGKWAFFVVGVKLDNKPNGMAEVWMAHNEWPDITRPPLKRRTGHDSWQERVGHNTIGQYSSHGKAGAYTGYFSRFGRATTAKRAIEIAR